MSKSLRVFRSVRFVSTLSTITAIGNFALAGGFGVGNGGDGLDTGVQSPDIVVYSAPAPVPTGNVAHFPELKQIWDKGTQTNEAMLTGDWKEVAFATNSACAYTGKDAYNAGGIRNSDGSIVSLHFSTMTAKSGGFGGDTSKSVFSVQILHLGHKGANQGPYEVDPNEPQFSQFSYNSIDQTLLRSYWEASCRAVAGDPNKILCAYELINDPADGATDASSIACAQSRQGVLDGFARVTAPAAKK